MDTNVFTFLLKNSVKYLHDLSTNSSKFPPALKSFYGSKYKILEDRASENLHRKVQKQDLSCSKCCIRFNESLPIYKVKPKRRPPLVVKNLLKRKNNGDVLNYTETATINKWKNADFNSIVKICVHCKNELSTPLVGYSKDKKEKRNQLINETNQQLKTTHKKKKKKKDGFSGLNKNVILSVTQNRNEEPNEASSKTNSKFQLVNNDLRIFQNNESTSQNDLKSETTKKLNTENKNPKNKIDQNITVVNSTSSQSKPPKVALNKHQKYKLMKEKVKNKKLKDKLKYSLISSGCNSASTVKNLKMFLSDL